ncbi:hypothetical protein [Aestuariibaculum sediminum]|uniref:Lipoprotein n=1 Tax=Aestuariibaculum sediminum TaxID=2770637 RepID=A0A8J6U813_9FLAO|nr:hypothetical protein [Aestuariibaculum sediminum]MBD0832650.1 hypothetical protein [Aestuariibaculum sediminum]
MKKFILPIITIILVSCNEDSVKSTIDTAVALEALNEYATVNKVFQDVGNNSGDAILASEKSIAISSKSLQASVEEVLITVTPLDLTTFPKTITIDYQDGVLCKDGVTRKGVVTVISTNWYGIPESEHTATFNNYYHNDYKVEGTHYVKNLGENNEGHLEYSVLVENGMITTPSGGTINYSEESTRTWVVGSDTPFNIWDDQYVLDGMQSGTSSKGIDYTLTTEVPLHFVLLPRNIESGIIDVDVADIQDIKLNYTNGTVTILGKTFPMQN